MSILSRLQGGEDNEDSGNTVAKQDRTINKAERSVRKNVLKHLAVSGGDHAVSALVLTSIIIDIERIGDYSKNIIELARKGPESPDLGDAEEDLNRVEEKITNPDIVNLCLNSKCSNFRNHKAGRKLIGSIIKLRILPRVDND